MEHRFNQTFVYEIPSRIFCEKKEDLIPKLEKLLSSPLGKALDCIWLMGVWHLSPASCEIARQHSGLQGEYSKVLPDWRPEDVAGSPYAIWDYLPDPGLTDWEELASIQNLLHQAGKKLLLDFVPNHMARDSKIFLERPELFLSLDSPPNDHAENYFQFNNRWYAHGRDPYFAGWTDTVQWDFSHPQVLSMHEEILLPIAEVCDGVRCDMAMLPLPHVFQKTHGKKAEDYWAPLLQRVRRLHPQFLFYAEAYWNLEYELQTLGFDGTYDKTLVDRLHQNNLLSVCAHLEADLPFQEKSIRFLENHDEERASSLFGLRSRDYFSLLAFLPGTLLYFAGQESGHQLRLPVQLARSPREKEIPELRDFYDRIFPILARRHEFPQPIQRRELNPFCFSGGKVLAYALVTSDFVLRELLLWNPHNNSQSGILSLETLISTSLPENLQDLVNGETYPQPKEERGKNQLYFSLQPGQAHWFIF